MLKSYGERRHVVGKEPVGFVVGLEIVGGGPEGAVEEGRSNGNVYKPRFHKHHLKNLEDKQCIFK